MKILITGSEGFIGQNAVKYFRKKGYKVYTADIKKGKDLREYQVCAKAVKGMDWVIHLAADNGGYSYINDPDNTHIAENNKQIDNNMAFACIDHGVKRMFYSSSSCVYPLNKHENSYGTEKYHAEKTFRSSPVPCSIARFQNVYGPYETIGGEKEKVIPAFCRQIIESSVILMQGDGKQKRSWIYVEDLCEQIETMMIKRVKLADLGGQIATIDEILEILLDCANKDLGVLKTMDKQKAKKFMKFKYKPKTSLQDGLLKTFNYVRRAKWSQ